MLIFALEDVHADGRLPYPSKASLPMYGAFLPATLGAYSKIAHSSRALRY